MTAAILVLCAAGGITAEAGIGAVASSDRDGSRQVAPGASVAAMYRAEFWSAGIAGLVMAGSPGYASGAVAFPHNGGLNAWALLAQAGLHTAAGLEVRAGVGVARLVLVQCDCSENQPLHGSIAPAFALSLGMSRAMTTPLRPGIQVSAMVFTGVRHESGSPGNPSAASPPAESGLLHLAGHVLLTVAWDAR